MAKTLTKIDAFFTEADSRFALTGTYDNQTLTLFDGDTFFDEVDYCYSERAILTRTNTPLEEFYKLFQRWSEGKGYGFIRSYAALLIEYNPTHNYDGTETVTTTTEFGKVVENESEGTTTNTPTLTSTTERSMYGYNSSTDVDADKAVTTAGGQDVTGVEGSGSVTESGTETVTVETEKGGNLGLTTNAQLLTGELKLRMYDLQKEAIANFINEYTVEYIEVDGDGFTFTSSDAVYTAGTGIDITNFVISVDDEVLNVISTNAENIEALQLSMSTAEDDIEDLDARVTTLENTTTQYTAGDNITIEDGVISATDTTYTAGANVSISDANVISATNTTYTAGTNVSISDSNVISATDTTYTAGDGIDITNNEISVDDATLTRISTAEGTLNTLSGNIGTFALRTANSSTEGKFNITMPDDGQKHFILLYGLKNTVPFMCVVGVNVSHVTAWVSDSSVTATMLNTTTLQVDLNAAWCRVAMITGDALTISVAS